MAYAHTVRKEIVVNLVHFIFSSHTSVTYFRASERKATVNTGTKQATYTMQLDPFCGEQVAWIPSPAAASIECSA